LRDSFRWKRSGLGAAEAARAPCGGDNCAVIGDDGVGIEEADEAADRSGAEFAPRTLAGDSEFVVDTGVAEQLISGACWVVRLFARPPASTSLALDPGQGVLDPGRRPGAPRHGEELEPLLDEEVRVPGGMKYIPAVMPYFAAVAAILLSAR
jgi:hypothetical protein